jgi:hypothetical protein
LQGFIFKDDQREEWHCTFETVHTIQVHETVRVRFRIMGVTRNGRRPVFRSKYLLGSSRS